LESRSLDDGHVVVNALNIAGWTRRGTELTGLVCHPTPVDQGRAARFETRIWAMESAGGVGYLLAQELVAAGEVVLYVPATLRPPGCGGLASRSSNENEPDHPLGFRACRPAL
jgi:hypothetical protein